jgi:hypothetical protein
VLCACADNAASLELPPLAPKSLRPQTQTRDAKVRTPPSRRLPAPRGRCHGAQRAGRRHGDGASRRRMRIKLAAKVGFATTEPVSPTQARRLGVRSPCHSRPREPHQLTTRLNCLGAGMGARRRCHADCRGKAKPSTRELCISCTTVVLA